jgi:hypothetical protein
MTGNDEKITWFAVARLSEMQPYSRRDGGNNSTVSRVAAFCLLPAQTPASRGAQDSGRVAEGNLLLCYRKASKMAKHNPLPTTRLRTCLTVQTRSSGSRRAAAEAAEHGIGRMRPPGGAPYIP